jgi:parvulin-like peptidyl-prolyl isomerase
VLGAAPTEWVVLDQLGSSDAYLQREGHASSLRRVGPWAVFAQRFVAVKDGIRHEGALPLEVMAVNCLTGATGVTRSEEHDDNGASLGMQPRRSLAEVEATTDFGRIALITPVDDLHKSIANLACTCKRPAALTTEPELKRTYERWVQRQMIQRRYRVGYIRVATKAEADALIARLKKGESFKALANQYSEAKEFPDGVIGFDAPGVWTVADRRLFDSLRPGQFTTQAREGVFGWEIHQLLAVRATPAPSFTKMRAQIERYVQSAKSCGWPLPAA